MTRTAAARVFEFNARSSGGEECGLDPHDGVLRSRSPRSSRSSLVSQAAPPTSTSRSTSRRRSDAAFPEETAQQLQDAVDPRDGRHRVVRRDRRRVGAVERHAGSRASASQSPTGGEAGHRRHAVPGGAGHPGDDLRRPLRGRRRGHGEARRPRDEVCPGCPRPRRRDARAAVRQHLGHRLVRVRSCGAVARRTRRGSGTRASSPATASASRARPSPGTAYRDSDAGYVLLGLALERATGRSAAAAHRGVRRRSARPRRDAAPAGRGGRAVDHGAGAERPPLAA